MKGFIVQRDTAKFWGFSFNLALSIFFALDLGLLIYIFIEKKDKFWHGVDFSKCLQDGLKLIYNLTLATLTGIPAKLI